MHRSRLFRGVAVLVTFLLTATIVAQAPAARATANAPSWTVGDHWSYSSSTGDPVSITVVARESVALVGGTYDTFHTTWTTAATITREEWVRTADIGVAKRLEKPFGVETVWTYDPPQALASFPVYPGKQWSGQSSFRVTVGSTTISTGVSPFSGSVESELDLAVPAGTFHVYVIRWPAGTGTSYTKNYYSDSVGYWVKSESYNAQDRKTGELILTGYGYQSAALTTGLIVGLVVIIVIAVIAFLAWRRKQALGRPGGPRRGRSGPPPGGPYQPPVIPSQPGYPPQQPPSGPPPTPP